MKQNIKNNKTTTIIASLVIGLMLLLPTAVLPNVGATSIQNTNAINNTDQGLNPSLDSIEKLLPAKLSDDELTTMKHLVLANENVKKIIQGKPYEFMAQDFIGNMKTAPGIWYPEIHINVANSTEITVVANLKNGSSIDMKTTPLYKLGPVNVHKQGTNMPLTTALGTFASDYYTGSASVDGIYAQMVAPTNVLTPKVAFLVNGLESGGSDDPNISCNSQYTQSSYFAQGGFDFSNSNGKVIYSDTLHNCLPQNPLIAYSPGHVYLFEVWVTRGTTQWNVLVEDLQGGPTAYYQYHGPSVISNTMRTSDPNTSVFFENHETTTGWANDFSSSVAASNAHYHDYNSNTWNLWNADAQALYNCSGLPISNNVMTGNLQNGGTTTWNMNNMQQDHC